MSRPEALQHVMSRCVIGVRSIISGGPRDQALAQGNAADPRPGLARERWRWSAPIVAPSLKRARAAPSPTGAIKVPLPTIEQPDDYSFGAAALMSICSFYGVGPKKIEGLKRRLHTDPIQGTNCSQMIRYAESRGLEVRWKTGMTTEELDEHLRQARPVICSIQAYSDDPAAYNDTRRNSNRHYVVAIGFDQDNYYVMAPSAPSEARVPRLGGIRSDAGTTTRGPRRSPESSSIWGSPFRQPGEHPLLEGRTQDRVRAVRPPLSLKLDQSRPSLEPILDSQGQWRRDRSRKIDVRRNRHDVT